MCNVSNILCNGIWLLWHYMLCHFFPFLKLDLYICCIPQDQLAFLCAPWWTQRPPWGEMLLQMWETAKFVNFNEAAVIHGNALFTAAVASKSIRHGPGPHFTFARRVKIMAKDFKWRVRQQQTETWSLILADTAERAARHECTGSISRW